MKTILIADDDQAIRRTLELHLTEEGYDVLTAASGRDAVDLARSRALVRVVHPAGAELSRVQVKPVDLEEIYREITH